MWLILPDCCCCCCCCVISVVSDTERPHRQQPTRLPRPWDSPGKKTGVGYHFLLQGMKVKSGSKVAQSCPILSDPMDCIPPGSSVHGIVQARILEWVAISTWKKVTITIVVSCGSHLSLGMMWWEKLYFCDILSLNPMWENH